MLDPPVSLPGIRHLYLPADLTVLATRWAADWPGRGAAWRTDRIAGPLSELAAGVADAYSVGVATALLANRNPHRLGLHRDRTVPYPAINAMVVVRDRASGGGCSFPGRGVTFACPHGSVLIFDGRVEEHGPTPIELDDPAGWRVSIVLYCPTADPRLDERPRNVLVS